MRSVGNAPLAPSSLRAIHSDAILTAAFAQLNMRSVRSRLPQVGSPTTVRSWHPTPSGRLPGALLCVGRAEPRCEARANHRAGSAHPANADSMSRPLTSASRADASRLESSDVRA